MFEDSLVESSGKLGRRNPRTIAFSFSVQMLAAGVLVLLPLIYTEALPEQHLLRFLEAQPPPQGLAATPQRHAKPAQSVSQLDDHALRVPNQIPRVVAMVPDEGTPTGDFLAVPNGVPKGSQDAVPNAIITTILRNTAIPLPKVAVQKVRVSSGVAQGLLVHQITPQYPKLARQARIEGTVVLQAVIGKDGTVQGLHVISGHPMLTQAAMEAVKQWRYRPYSLNGEPVEVDTQINVNFTLRRG